MVRNDNDFVAGKLQNFPSLMAKHIRTHRLWVTETRGDCYIVMSGSNMVMSDDTASQATRMLEFTRDLIRKRKLGFDIRIGIATGVAGVSFIYGSTSVVPITCTTGAYDTSVVV